MKGSIETAAYIVGFLLFMGLLFDGCMISMAINDVAQAVRLYH